MKVSPWLWLLWTVIGLVGEGIALFNTQPGDTLTGTLVSHVPGWLAFMGIGWLIYHFQNAYRDHGKQR